VSGDAISEEAELSEVLIGERSGIGVGEDLASTCLRCTLAKSSVLFLVCRG
jgi:hypothetical protein